MCRADSQRPDRQSRREGEQVSLTLSAYLSRRRRSLFQPPRRTAQRITVHEDDACSCSQTRSHSREGNPVTFSRQVVTSGGIPSSDPCYSESSARKKRRVRRGETRRDDDDDPQAKYTHTFRVAHVYTYIYLSIYLSSFIYIFVYASQWNLQRFFLSLPLSFSP